MVFHYTNYIKLLIVLCIISLTHQEEKTSLLSTNGAISFTKINDYTLDLATYKTNIQYLLKKSLIVIEVIVKSDIDNSKGQSQPIRIYSKLNDAPRPESFYYDKKDDIANYNKETKEYVYTFEYSPCEVGIDDKLFIKVVGIEGTSTYALNIYLLNANEYKIICPSSENDISRVHAGIATTINGVAQFGGQKMKDDNNTYDVTNDMFILNEDNEWNYVNYSDTSIPCGRYGMGIEAFDHGKYILIYGGKDNNESVINDMWVYIVQSDSWYLIYDSNNKIPSFPKNKFMPSSVLIDNKGIIIIYGGNDSDSDNASLFVLDIAILKQLINVDNDDSKRKKELFTQLFSLYTITELTPRYGASLTQISNNELMIYGGFDISNDYLSNNCEIINIDTFTFIEKISNTNGPTPRMNHAIKRYGNVLFLYGGTDSNGNDMNDMWKYVIPNKTWVKIVTEVFDIHFFKIASSLITTNYFSKYKNTERPLIFPINSGNEIILLNIPICQSDTQTYSGTLCLPCELGYELSGGQCEMCYPGKFFNFDEKEGYSKSKCISCPIGTYNPYYAMNEKSSCSPCPFGTQNGNVGQIECNACANSEICLIGSTSPMFSNYHNDYISNYDITKANYLQVDNYPEFIDQNSKMKYLSLTVGLITVSVLTTLVIIIFVILLKVKKQKTVRFLICVDFLPLTGGSVKKSNGGLITIVYSILISSLAISFILRYVLWNNIVEITTIDDNGSSTDNELKSSFDIEIDLYGENIPCVFEANEEKEKKNKEENFTECSSDITFAKNDNLTYFLIDKAKLFKCKKDNNICHIRFQCDNCNHFANKDTLDISISNPSVYISLYKWTFKNYWNDYLSSDAITDSNIGRSILTGIFKPNDDIENTQYVFKGNEKKSIIEVLLSPIFYSIKSNNKHLSGYRLSLASYERGDVRNEYSFGNDSEGVSIGIEFEFNQSKNMVTVKKDISLLDFFAFILGMLAGFSFLSRVSKFIFESCGLLNYSDDNFKKLTEEMNQNIEMNNNNNENNNA